MDALSFTRQHRRWKTNPRRAVHAFHCQVHESNCKQVTINIHEDLWHKKYKTGELCIQLFNIY